MRKIDVSVYVPSIIVDRLADYNWLISRLTDMKMNMQVTVNDDGEVCFDLLGYIYAGEKGFRFIWNMRRTNMDDLEYELKNFIEKTHDKMFGYE